MAVVKTSRKDQAAIQLKRGDLLAGQYLEYKLVVSGSQAVFALVDDKKRVIMTNNDFPPAQQEYKRKWPLNSAEIPAEADVTHTLTLSFISATKYVYVVRHYDKGDNEVALVKDIDYESDDANDKTFNTLRIFL
ncbi:MAG TPA: hypothetical protein VI704_07905 [Bacteroidota bacterium]|nr:hypothetical protein [Bacteroidota bacterium]